MRKFFVVLTAFAFVMAMGLPALADVFVYGTIDKDKDKYVYEDVDITKTHFVGVKQLVMPSSSAEAQALKNDVNQWNMVKEREIEAVPAVDAEYDYNDQLEQYTLEPGTGTEAIPAVKLTKDAIIEMGTLDAASGIVSVNQSPGSINNQGNAASISYSDSAIGVRELVDAEDGKTRFVGGAFLHAESSAELVNGGFMMYREGGAALSVNDANFDEECFWPVANFVDAIGSTRTDKIDGSLIGVSGIIGVNQSAGNINNQNNAASLSVGDGIAALSEADLGMCNSGNKSIEEGTVTLDTLTGGALADASGIIGINQSSGCMNNQANVVAACVITFE
jgi:hypothetical protein